MNFYGKNKTYKIEFFEELHAFYDSDKLSFNFNIDSQKHELWYDGKKLADIYGV